MVLLLIFGEPVFDGFCSRSFALTQVTNGNLAALAEAGYGCVEAILAIFEGDHLFSFFVLVGTLKARLPASLRRIFRKLGSVNCCLIFQSIAFIGADGVFLERLFDF